MCKSYGPELHRQVAQNSQGHVTTIVSPEDAPPPSFLDLPKQRGVQSRAPAQEWTTVHFFGKIYKMVLTMFSEATRSAGTAIVTMDRFCVVGNVVQTGSVIYLKMFRLLTFTLAVVLSGCLSCAEVRVRPAWSYNCVDGVCERVMSKDAEIPQALPVCKALCNPHAMLWPIPTGELTLSTALIAVNPNDVTVIGTDLGDTSQVKDMLAQATVRLQSQLVHLAELAEVPPERHSLALHVAVTLSDPEVIRFAEGVDESYELVIGPAEEKTMPVTIKAANFFGARHGLETLSQLAVSDDSTHTLLMFDSATVTDAPKFHYRGVNLDTSRNYFSVDSIKRTIEGMAINKMNTFHWHITDSHSWPFVSDNYPQLSRLGAYSLKQIYTPANIKDIVEYARVRGVRVVPELDAPAHVGEGFQWTDPGTIVCYKAQPWENFCVEPPCGQLNPTRQQAYNILNGVYSDMLKLFDSDIFHMGGDEVNIGCWNSSSEVVDGMAALGFDRTHDGFIELWDYFQSKALKGLVERNGKELPVIIWTSGLTESNIEDHLDKNTYIIEIWTKGNDQHIAELVNKGYRVIFSNYEALYLDCGFGGWVTDGNNWCSPYIGWQKVYDNSPLKLLNQLGVDPAEAKRLTWGAEASLWTEQVDDSCLDNRLWPRVAAMAERLWSDPEQDWRAAEIRMVNHRQRLQQQGLQPDSIQPQWCHQNEGYCPVNN